MESDSLPVKIPVSPVSLPQNGMQIVPTPGACLRSSSVGECQTWLWFVAITLQLAALSEHLTCTICLGQLTNSTVTPCGHRYCRECIAEFVDRRWGSCFRTMPLFSPFFFLFCGSGTWKINARAKLLLSGKNPGCNFHQHFLNANYCRNSTDNEIAHKWLLRNLCCKPFPWLCGF